MASVALRCLAAWTEDRATQRCDPSAAPGAETGARAKLGFALLPPSLRDRRKSDKPSRQDAAIRAARCRSRFANVLHLKFQFTLNQCVLSASVHESFRAA